MLLATASSPDGSCRSLFCATVVGIYAHLHLAKALIAGPDRRTIPVDMRFRIFWVVMGVAGVVVIVGVLLGWLGGKGPEPKVQTSPVTSASSPPPPVGYAPSLERSTGLTATSSSLPIPA